MSFHNSHIKWILYTYAAFHLLTAGATFCIFSLLKAIFAKYSFIAYAFIAIELVLAAECPVVRHFLKRFYKSGLQLFFLYLSIRISISFAACIFLVVEFPHMFPDLFALVFSTESNLMNSSMSILYAAPLFVISFSNLALSVMSLLYYIRRRRKFK